jgi:hypothetical protein
LPSFSAWQVGPIIVSNQITQIHNETHDNILVVFIFFVILFIVIVVEIYAATLLILLIVSRSVWRIDFVFLVFVYRPARGLGSWRDVILVDFRRGIEVFLFLFGVATVGRHVCGWMW